MENKCKNCGSKSKNSKCPHSINYEHDFDNINIQEETEILKMSDNNLVEKFEEECIHQWSSGDKLIIREELLKRLSKNKPEIWSYTNITPEQAVDEFKNELIKEILDELPVTGVKHLEDIKFLNRDVIIDIIKNTK